MNLFFCLLCSRTSYLDERFRCIHCGNGLGSRTVVADNLNLQVPGPENAIPGCYVPDSSAGSQKSEVNFMLVEPTKEVNNQMYEENSNFPLQIAGRHGYKNCSKSESPSQIKTLHAFDKYNNEIQNHLPANSNINEGEFHDRFYDVNYPATLVEAVYDTTAALEQTYLSEESAVSECESKNDSDELLRRQGTEALTERGIKSDSLLLKDSITLKSKYPAENLISDSSEKVEDRDNIFPPFAFCPRGNPSMNKCFQEISPTAIGVAQQTPQNSNKLSKMRCKKCRRYFRTLSTFIAHARSNCHPIPFKCGLCDERFSCMTLLIKHGRVHTGEKPFKCTQCDYATKWPYILKKHLEIHR